MSFLRRQESHHQLQNPLCCCKIHTFITHYLSLSHQQLSLLKGVPLTLRQGIATGARGNAVHSASPPAAAAGNHLLRLSLSAVHRPYCSAYFFC